MATKVKKKVTTAKSNATIERNLRGLRELIDASNDPVETRIAYAMETAVRWALEKTVSWPKLVQQAQEEAYLLRREVGLPDPQHHADTAEQPREGRRMFGDLDASALEVGDEVAVSSMGSADHQQGGACDAAP